MTITLVGRQPFAKGGHRLCFVHPDNPARCIKVRRPDFPLEECRRRKGFPKNLRPLSSFDDNFEELRVVKSLLRSRGQIIYQHIYQCFDFVDTDLGKGLETELIRDDDGQISLSLKQYIWQYGFHAGCRAAVKDLTTFWLDHCIPSRDLLTHNVVVQQTQDQKIARLVVIDGLGSPSTVPFSWLPEFLRKRLVVQRVRRFEMRIESFVGSCDSGKVPSQVGMLQHRG